MAEVCLEIAGLPPAKGDRLSPLSPAHPHHDRARLLLEAAARTIGPDRRCLVSSVGLEMTLLVPEQFRVWDATNFLGGVADVLEKKDRRRGLDHLGELRNVALYANDRQIREVRYRQEVAPTVGYRVRIWAVGDPRYLDERAITGRQWRHSSHVPLMTGNLCLDFVNWLQMRGGEPLASSVTGYQDLSAWFREAGVLSEGEVGDLTPVARSAPSDAEAVVREGLALGAALTGIFRAYAYGRQPTRDDVAVLNSLLRSHLSHERLVLRDGRVVWSWDVGRGCLDRMLWAVTRAAVDLLASKTLTRVRVCAAVVCGQLFLDTSKNATRRWCRMNVCGNRAKARRSYARRQRARRTPRPRPRGRRG